MPKPSHDFSKIWEEYYKGVQMPVAEVATLSTQMLNNALARNTHYINELLKVRKTEEAVTLQSKFMAETSSDLCEYYQQAFMNFFKCLNKTGTHFCDATSDWHKTACKRETCSSPTPKEHSA